MLVLPFLTVLLLPQGPGELPEGIDLQQEIALVLEPFPMVKLSVRCRGTAEGETAFTLPEEWGGARECWKEVRTEGVTNAGGRALELRRTAPGEWRVRHEPGETLLLTYDLVPTRQLVDHDTQYRPIIDAHRVHLIGSTSFLLPEHLDKDRAQAIELRWKGFVEAGWPMVCSFGTDPVLRFEATLARFRHAVYLASAQLELRERECAGQRVVTALSEEAWLFTADDLADTVQQIVAHERAFFEDDDFPYFVVTAIPVGQPSAQGLSLGGTGLTNAFSLFLQPEMSLAPGTNSRERLLHLLAHEHFHTWNGRVIERAQPEELVYWFSEGFTDYYARRLLLRAGLFTPAEYLADVNENLQRFAQNEMRHEPNARILADFWNDQLVERLPYQRGAIVAMLCDHEIRTASEGRQSLDDMMLELAARGRSRGEKISTPGLLTTIVGYTSQEFSDQIRAIVEGGAEPLLPPSLEPDMEVVLELVPGFRFDLGFDVEASKETGILVGVRSGSPAHEAGLRNGQELLGWSLHGGLVDEEVELTIDDAGTRRVLRYLPRGEELQMGRYSLKAEK